MSKSRHLSMRELFPPHAQTILDQTAKKTAMSKPLLRTPQRFFKRILISSSAIIPLVFLYCLVKNADDMARTLILFSIEHSRVLGGITLLLILCSIFIFPRIHAVRKNKNSHSLRNC